MAEFVIALIFATEVMPSLASHWCTLGLAASLVFMELLLWRTTQQHREAAF